MLIRTFSDLYSTARLDTLDALDALPDLRTQMLATGASIGRVDAEELKNKLLFSVVVVREQNFILTFLVSNSSISCACVLYAIAPKKVHVCLG